jgi:hypothetical protein
MNIIPIELALTVMPELLHKSPSQTQTLARDTVLHDTVTPVSPHDLVIMTAVILKL